MRFPSFNPGHALSVILGLSLALGPVLVEGSCGGIGHVKGSKRRIGDFVHPGLWHTHDDLERMRLGVDEGKEPYASAFANFSKSPFSQADVSRPMIHHD